MKRRDFFVGIVIACVLSTGITYGVTQLTKQEHSGSNGYKKVEYVNTPGSAVGTHFTAYDRDNYPDLTYAAENAVKAVVNIENIQEYQVRPRSRGYGGYDPFLEFFGMPQPDDRGSYQQEESEPKTQERRSGGSGVIISADGYIVTNNHVVKGADKLKVTLNDDRVFDARLIGTDPSTDVALIKIEADDLPTLPFGNSDELRLGEWVLAIGSPFDLRSTITAGIVSAKARSMGAINTPGDLDIESFIQTDAAVNPGNSGGALINVKGELVGINTLIASPTGSYAGYSFAVPVSLVQKVVDDLREYGVVQRALLGIRYGIINDQFLEAAEKEGLEINTTEKEGAYVLEVVSEGAAEAAGIREGDVITEIDGIKVNAQSTIQEQVARHRPGDKVTLTVKRDGKTKQIEVVLRNKSGQAELYKPNYVDPVEALGAQFSPISDKQKRELKIRSGLQVTEITEGGILSRARVREGYIITHINDRSIGSVNDIYNIADPITDITGIYPDGREMGYVILPQ